MGRQLSINCPLLFDRLLAKTIGLNEAIVLQRVRYWIEKIKKEIETIMKTDTGPIIPMKNGMRNFHSGVRIL